MLTWRITHRAMSTIFQSARGTMSAHSMARPLIIGVRSGSGRIDILCIRLVVTELNQPIQTMHVAVQVFR